MAEADAAHSDPGTQPGDVGATSETPVQLAAAAEARLDVRADVDALIEHMKQQANHNAPLAPGFIRDLQAIRAKLG